MPHLIAFAVALVCTIIFCLIAFAMTLADFEMNPVSLRWMASPHTRVEMRRFWVQTIMTVTVPLLFGQVKIQAIILFAVSVYLFYSYIRWVRAGVPEGGEGGATSDGCVLLHFRFYTAP